MRVGLLICDHIPAVLRDHGDYEDMFGNLFADHPEIDLVPYDLTVGDFPAATDECDGWIITGSAKSVYDDEPWIRQLENLVRLLVSEHRKLVGICFGHQMIGQALGGRVARSDRGWGVGIKDVVMKSDEAWMDPPADSFRVVHSHADQIVELPAGVRVLAANDHCPVSMLAYDDHVLGIQGHPEFVQTFARDQMRIRRGKLISEDVVDDGLATLSIPPDRNVLASWIASFLSEPSSGTGKLEF